jgi:hypothetical protein
MLSVGDREIPLMTGRSGTQRARPAFSRRDCPQLAGDGPRPVRAGSAWPLVSDRRGCRGSDAQGVGPEDAFCEAVLERIFGCPLTVEGHPRTLSGPSPDPNPAWTLAPSARLPIGLSFRRAADQDWRVIVSSRYRALRSSGQMCGAARALARKSA